MSARPAFWRRGMGPVLVPIRVQELGLGLRLGIGLVTGLVTGLGIALGTGQRAIAAEFALSVARSVAPSVTLSAAADSLCPADLPAAIDAIADRPPWQRSRWGILVQTLDGDQTLYARDAQHYFIPASNGKLLTTAAALTRLGGDFRMRTVVYASTGEIQAPTGTTLTVVGRGDPSLSDDSLRQLAQQVRDRGITQVDRLIADDRYIPDSLIHPNWEWEDIQAGYGAPVTSLMVNENAIALNLFPQAIGQPLRAVWVDAQEGQRWRLDNQTRTVAADQPGYVWVERDLGQAVLHLYGQLPVGSTPVQEAIAVPDPTEHFLRHFRQALMAAGVSVRQTQVVPSGAIAEDSTNTTEIAAIASPPLSTLLITANQDSNNLYAEALLRILGIALAAPDLPESSLESGITAVESILTPLGVDPEGYALADGSGLSRHNLASPSALVQTLQAMADAPSATTFRQSLAVAGVSGTLRRRFLDTAIAGRLWGKSGAMGGVASLSGYLEPPHYPPLAFSIVVNQFEQPVRQVRPAIDEIVVLLGRLRPC